MYGNGQGVARDETKAAAWYRKAAEHGDPFTQFDLGLAYALGRGVERDDVQAANWYKRSAPKGFKPGQTKLDSMTRSNLGKTEGKRTS